MSDWDPFKPVDWGKKKKDESNFFEPVGSSGKEEKNFWSSSGDSKSGSWAFETSSKSKSDGGYIGWGAGGSDAKSSDSWGFSTGSDKNSDNFWSSSGHSSDALGFGAHSSLMSLKAREDSMKVSGDWKSSDVSWTFANVSAQLEVGAAIGRAEDSQKSWAFSPSKSSSSWAFSAPENMHAKAKNFFSSADDRDSSTWGWNVGDANPDKLKRGW